MKKYHYYSFSFSFADGPKITTSSVYIGYDKKPITKPQIDAAKEHAGTNSGAVLLSCCYLGKMTADEMNNGLTNRSTLTGKAAWVFGSLKNLVRFPGK